MINTILWHLFMVCMVTFWMMGLFSLMVSSLHPTINSIAYRKSFMPMFGGSAIIWWFFYTANPYF